MCVCLRLNQGQETRSRIQINREHQSPLVRHGDHSLRTGSHWYQHFVWFELLLHRDPLRHHATATSSHQHVSVHRRCKCKCHHFLCWLFVSEFQVNPSVIGCELQVIGWEAGLYPDPALVLLFDVLEREEPFRPMGRKGLDSAVMTMLGIRPSAPLIT